MVPHDLIAKLPDLGGVLAAAVIGGVFTLNVERRRGKAEEKKTEITEEGLDRRQLIQDATKIMDEMRTEIARAEKAKSDLFSDNQHLAAVVVDQREERQRLLHIIDDAEARIKSQQAKLLALYERIAALSSGAPTPPSATE